MAVSMAHFRSTTLSTKMGARRHTDADESEYNDEL